MEKRRSEMANEGFRKALALEMKRHDIKSYDLMRECHMKHDYYGRVKKGLTRASATTAGCSPRWPGLSTTGRSWS